MILGSLLNVIPLSDHEQRKSFELCLEESTILTVTFERYVLANFIQIWMMFSYLIRSRENLSFCLEKSAKMNSAK